MFLLFYWYLFFFQIRSKFLFDVIVVLKIFFSFFVLFSKFLVNYYYKFFWYVFLLVNKAFQW